MHEAQYQAGVRISRAPLDEWADRIRQPSLAQGPKEKTGESQGDLGGRGPQNCVGLPYHSPVHHQGDTF